MITFSFAEIYTQVQNFIQDTSSGTLTVIKNEINIEYEKIAKSRMWDELMNTWDDGIVYTSGEAYFALPADCAFPSRLVNETAGYALIPRNTDSLLGDNAVDLNQQSGAIVFYSPLGLRATRRPLSVADTLEILSSASADIGLAIRIVGVRNTELVQHAEEITTNGTNGTTPVAGAVSWRQGWSIESIGTNAVPAGIITVRETTADTILAYLPVGQKQTQHYVVRLENPPDTADAITVHYKRKPRRLTDDDDVTVIPVSQYLIEKTIAKMRQFDRKYLQSQVHKSEAADDIMATMSERRIQQPVIRQARPLRWGKLSRGY